MSEEFQRRETSSTTSSHQDHCSGKVSNVLCRVEVFEALHVDALVARCVDIDISVSADAQCLLYTWRTIAIFQFGRKGRLLVALLQGGGAAAKTISAGEMCGRNVQNAGMIDESAKTLYHIRS